MISRSYGSVEPFDRAVKQLRQHFHLASRPRKNPRQTTTNKIKAKPTFSAVKPRRTRATFQ